MKIKSLEEKKNRLILYSNIFLTLSFVGLFTLLTVTLLYPLKETKSAAEDMDKVFTLFFPHYCLGKAFINIYVRYTYRINCEQPNKQDLVAMIYAGGNLILTGSFFNFVDGRCIYYLYHLFKILFSLLICLFSFTFS